MNNDFNGILPFSILQSTYRNDCRHTFLLVSSIGNEILNDPQTRLGLAPQIINCAVNLKIIFTRTIPRLPLNWRHPLLPNTCSFAERCVAKQMTCLHKESISACYTTVDIKSSLFNPIYRMVNFLNSVSHAFWSSHLFLIKYLFYGKFIDIQPRPLTLYYNNLIILLCFCL